MPPDPSLRKHHGNWRFGFSAARIYARRAEPEPPVTMMLSHFSGGNPGFILFFSILKPKIADMTFVRVIVTEVLDHFPHIDVSQVNPRCQNGVRKTKSRCNVRWKIVIVLSIS